jgi:hypothetical protein
MFYKEVPLLFIDKNMQIDLIFYFLLGRLANPATATHTLVSTSLHGITQRLVTLPLSVSFDSGKKKSIIVDLDPSINSVSLRQNHITF